MNPTLRLWQLIALVGVAMAVWLGFTVVLVASALEPTQRAQLQEWLQPQLGLVVVCWAVGLGLAAAGLRWLVQRYVAEPARLAEKARVLLQARMPQHIPLSCPQELRPLAQVINELGLQRDSLRQEMGLRVEEASRHVQEERNRLAALMAELTQSVVVCNLDGRIVLYNSQARRQLRLLSRTPTLSDGADVVGIGRSIYAVLDPELISHALDRIQGTAPGPTAQPSAQFLTTTPAGALLRVQMAPVGDGPAPAQGGALSGFVLMLDDVTQSFEAEMARDRLLHGLTERNRSSLASMQAAVEILGYSDLGPPVHARFLSVLRDEVSTMVARMADLAESAAHQLKTRWPMEDVLGADLALAVQRRAAREGGVEVGLDEVAPNVWLRVDSLSLMQALLYLSRRVQDEFAVQRVAIRLQRVDERAQLDLQWAGTAVGPEAVLRWELEPMRLGAETTPLSVREVVDRHGGEMWFERHPERQTALFRFLLPLADSPTVATSSPPAPPTERAEYYDFDLFRASALLGGLDDQPLAALAYTVFDTETTGLDPTGGDEIIQIGAVRIVNGKLLRQECFDQLVDPRRGIPPSSVAIHGIAPAMVKGQPDIATVLPTFHAYARDSVLVAHNAAFDMRFFQLKEAVTGVIFQQPVLDTLLLSAVIHPLQANHHLEGIADMLHIPVRNRHTALGDALLTAEVFLRFIPLLQAMGIYTLRDAMEASRKTLQARLAY